MAITFAWYQSGGMSLRLERPRLLIDNAAIRQGRTEPARVGNTAHGTRRRYYGRHRGRLGTQVAEHSCDSKKFDSTSGISTRD